MELVVNSGGVLRGSWRKRIENDVFAKELA
jgi:hypothetical protein